LQAQEGVAGHAVVRGAGVSTSGYFEHRRSKDQANPANQVSDEALLVHIKAIHAEVKRRLRLAADLEGTAGRGIRVGKDRVQS
jgi:putative transposase